MVASWLLRPGSFAKYLDVSRRQCWHQVSLGDVVGFRDLDRAPPSLAGALWAWGQTLGQMVHSSCSLTASTTAAGSLVCVVHGHVRCPAYGGLSS